MQVVSFVRHDPGIDLTSVGMQGCFRYTGLEAVLVVIPVGGQSVYTMPIPTSNSYQGLPLNAQTWAFSPGSNAQGIVTSNGLAMIVGQ